MADVRFNPLFLKRQNGSTVDVSRFSAGNPVTAGDYSVDILVNGAWVGRDTVRFRKQHDSRVSPCLDKGLLKKLNLDELSLPVAQGDATARADIGECVAPPAISADIGWQFDFNELRLEFSVPQALLRRAPRGTVDPRQWDEGVPSATLAYNFNTFHTTGRGTSTYLGLDAGLNLGTWHLRQRSAMSWQSAGPESYDYQNIATYLQHDIPSLRSQLTIGDAFTDGAVFDTFSVRGINLATDDRMLPDSARGYAPLVRGVARSNARVTVTQNGNRLYETTVAPGPFEINDLYATGYGGNLLVTVSEADGSQSTFAVPYASVVQLLRPGMTRYSATAGEYLNSSLKSSHGDKLVQGTVQHGFSNLVTGYGGLVLAEGYQAGLLGAAFNLPIGAVALDVTHANARIPNIDHASGQSIRLSYSKFVPVSSTNLTIAAYRYATSGYWSMHDAMAARAGGAGAGVAVNDIGGTGGANGPLNTTGATGSVVVRPRSQVQLTINQALGDRWGNVYLTGSSIDYWGRSQTTMMFQAGYSNTLRLPGTSVSYNVAASRQRDATTGRLSTLVFLGLLFPLGSSPQAPMLSLSATRNTANGSSQQMRLNGSALEDNALAYGLSADHAAGSTFGSGNLQYRSPYATVSASVSGGRSFTQYSAGLQGALVAHPGGVTLANFLGDTIGIVEAKGAEGARVTNSPGVRIDPFGYAVVPYLQPYNMNTIDLDPKGIPLDVSLDATSAQVAPRANSTVRIRFAALPGRSAIVVARQSDGQPLPFGAMVRDHGNAEVGAVGQGGVIFARGIADTGELTVIWGARGNEACTLPYQLPPKNGRPSFHTQIDAVCRPLEKE